MEQNGSMYELVTLLPDDRNYPCALRVWPGRRAPELLYCMGDTGLFQNHPKVLICGARNASQKALDLAGICAAQCGYESILVISGFARGVDLIAHKDVLQAGGSTIAVLPYGIRHIRYDEVMAGYISEQRMLMVSELHPSSNFKVSYALRRNRVMVALSDAVIVVEPGDTGGTWSSANAAKEFGRPLFYISGERPECSDKLDRLGGQEITVTENGIPDITPLLSAITGR